MGASPASLAVNKTRYFSGKVEPSPAVFLAIEQCVFNETSGLLQPDLQRQNLVFFKKAFGHFLPCLWQPKPHIFHRKSGHFEPRFR